MYAKFIYNYLDRLLNRVLPLILLIAFFSQAQAGEVVTLAKDQEQCQPQSSLHAEQLSSIPKSINLISGIPLTSSQDRTGGFGDVSSNIMAAYEFKGRYPETRIQLFITDSKYTDEAGKIKKSTEIAKVMIPSLDLTNLDRPQRINGIDIFILSTPYEELYKGAPSIPELPRADLSIQYTANRSSGLTSLGRLSPINLAFWEYGESRILSSPYNNPETEVQWFSLFTGLADNELGVAQSKKDERAFLDWGTIEKNLSEGLHKTVSFANSKVGFAMGKNPVLIELYVEAFKELAQREPHTKFILLANYQANIELSETLIPNFEIVPISFLDYETIESLVYRVPIAPLVAGDTLFAVALKRTFNNRYFVHEILDWKEPLEISMQRLMEKSLMKKYGLLELLAEKKFKSFTLRKSDSQLEGQDKKRKIEGLTSFLQDHSLQKTIAKTLAPQLKSKDLYANTIKAYQLLRSKLDYLRACKTTSSEIMKELYVKLGLKSSSPQKVSKKNGTFQLIQQDP